MIIITIIISAKIPLKSLRKITFSSCNCAALCWLKSRHKDTYSRNDSSGRNFSLVWAELDDSVEQSSIAMLLLYDMLQLKDVVSSN